MQSRQGQKMALLLTSDPMDELQLCCWTDDFRIWTHGDAPGTSIFTTRPATSDILVFVRTGEPMTPCGITHSSCSIADRVPRCTAPRGVRCRPLLSYNHFQGWRSFAA